MRISDGSSEVCAYDLHIHAEAVVAVDEDRPCADLGNGADRRQAGIRRGDDLVAGPDPQRLQRYLQGIGAGADADGVAGTAGLGTHRLELTDHLAQRVIARTDHIAQLCENRLGGSIMLTVRGVSENTCQAFRSMHCRMTSSGES